MVKCFNNGDVIIPFRFVALSVSKSCLILLMIDTIKTFPTKTCFALRLVVIKCTARLHTRLDILHPNSFFILRSSGEHVIPMI